MITISRSPTAIIHAKPPTQSNFKHLFCPGTFFQRMRAKNGHLTWSVFTWSLQRKLLNQRNGIFIDDNFSRIVTFSVKPKFFGHRELFQYFIIASIFAPTFFSVERESFFEPHLYHNVLPWANIFVGGSQILYLTAATTRCCCKKFRVILGSRVRFWPFSVSNRFRLNHKRLYVCGVCSVHGLV